MGPLIAIFGLANSNKKKVGGREGPFIFCGSTFFRARRGPVQLHSNGEDRCGAVELHSSTATDRNAVELLSVAVELWEVG